MQCNIVLQYWYANHGVILTPCHLHPVVMKHYHLLDDTSDQYVD